MTTDTLRHTLRRYGRKALELVYPGGCMLCGSTLMTSERFVCTPCLESLPRTLFELRSHNPMAERLARDCDLQGAAAYFYYRPGTPMATLVQNFKYGGFHALARCMGRYVGQRMIAGGQFGDADALVPVPMHWSKRMRRGYNQTESIARGLAEATGIPVVRMLRARRRHSTQTRKTHAERLDNVRGAFGVRLPEAMPTHAVIIDDIFTTGATMRECVATLAAAFPAMRVSVFTLGFAGEL